MTHGKYMKLKFPYPYMKGCWLQPRSLLYPLSPGCLGATDVSLGASPLPSFRRKFAKSGDRLSPANDRRLSPPPRVAARGGRPSTHMTAQPR